MGSAPHGVPEITVRAATRKTGLRFTVFLLPGALDLSKNLLLPYQIWGNAILAEVEFYLAAYLPGNARFWLRALTHFSQHTGKLTPDRILFVDRCEEVGLRGCDN